jgi:hypothetical protein
MKGRLLLAAALIAGGTSAAKADPVGMFNIQQATPSSIIFSGEGTAQFNSSTSLGNSFNVGSSTSLGVNASVSATPDFAPTANANLDLAQGSKLLQTIGTASNAANTQAVTEAAQTAAFSAANSSSFGVSWEAYQAANEGNLGSYTTEAAWKVGWESKYDQAYENVQRNSQTTSSTTSSDGTISGRFVTSEQGQAGGSGATQSYDWAASAIASTTQSLGERTDTNAVAWDTAYQNAYSSASAAAGHTTTSDVTVQGIGSIANVAAADTSNFSVAIESAGTAAGGTATANGSAGASLATQSFANQNTSSSASAFIQAFAAN